MRPAWIGTETAGVDFGDERLNERYRVVLDRLSQKPSVSIPVACGSWKETQAAYRFFQNEQVEETQIFASHETATLQRIRPEKVVLIIQDTTELDLSRRLEKVNGAGPLNEESRWGYYLHPLLAVTPERIPLGVLHPQVWARDLEEFKRDKKTKEKAKKEREIKDKESHRWLVGYQHACALATQAPETLVVVLSDSEGDIFECFLEATPQAEKKRAAWIIRAGQDRRLAEKTAGGRWQKLWEELQGAEVQGTLRIQVRKSQPSTKDKRKRKQGRSARDALVEVRAKSVLLRGPERTENRLADTAVNAVYVREISSPPEGEEPLDWLLLTSLPIGSFTEVSLIVDYYCCRWQIEIYFKVLKSGCKIEQRQFEEGDHYRTALAVYLLIAWRVMYVMMLGRECPELPCDLIFSEAEWQAVYVATRQAAPPKKPPSLGVLILLIAQLGGYLGRTHDGPPGPKTMWIGLQRLADLAWAWRCFGPGHGGG